MSPSAKPKHHHLHKKIDRLKKVIENLTIEIPALKNHLQHKPDSINYWNNSFYPTIKDLLSITEEL